MVLMAMLGGTYIFGGRGTILGTFLAAWLLVIVSTGMIVANVLPGGPARRAGQPADRRHHRHQSHLFPHPEVSGDYSAGQQPALHRRNDVLKKLYSRPGARSRPYAPPAPWRRIRCQDRLYRQEHRQPVFRLDHRRLRRRLQVSSAASLSSWPRPPPKPPRRSRSSKRRSSAASNVIAIAPNSPDALNQVLDDGHAPRASSCSPSTATSTGNETHRDATILPVNFDQRPARTRSSWWAR